jgi:hypothetical protein
MSDRSSDSLDTLLARLPLEVQPSRDLWPAIEGRLQTGMRRPRVWAWAAAAALAGAFVAGTLTFALMRANGGLAGGRPVSAALFDEPRDAHYVSARATLQQSFEHELVKLDPDTRARIEASLEVIRRAHEDIRKALADDPASPVLQQLWESTGRDELDLYERVIRGTQPALTRT